MKKVKVTVSGRVHGVWFRATTREIARELGVNGYVKNLANGDVEFVAEGDDSSVDKLIQWARRGPPSAIVDDVKVDDLEYNKEYNEFRIEY